jgi:branched-chain amino acid transport system ATP-binding protein
VSQATSAVQAAGEGAAFLEVRHLSAGYDSASQVLFDLSFTIRAHQVTTLLGRNGMGKTTTIRCLMGLLRAREGEILLGGRHLEHAPAHVVARCGLGLVPEGRQVFPRLIVEENLLVAARTDYGSHWTLESVYALFPRLQERRLQGSATLSGGEQQMLAIGRALMTNPQLLILDEATEGLAPLIRQQIWKALTALKQQGLSILIVDKNLDALQTFADQHLVLEKGRLVWSGDAHAFMQQRQEVQRYIGL